MLHHFEIPDADGRIIHEFASDLSVTMSGVVEFKVLRDCVLPDYALIDGRKFPVTYAVHIVNAGDCVHFSWTLHS